jgi:hypothetical protein
MSLLPLLLLASRIGAERVFEGTPNTTKNVCILFIVAVVCTKVVNVEVCIVVLHTNTSS